VSVRLATALEPISLGCCAPRWLPWLG
jgi:hypothetical protein